MNDGRLAVLSLTLSLAAAPLVAQDANAPQPTHDPVFFAPAPPPGAGPGGHFMVLGHEDAFELKTVKGAPYQAEAVTEVVQVLADGNRIVRKSSSPVYRDGEGRVRREHSLAAFGPFTPSKAPHMVFIHDPVAGADYVLDADRREARKMTPPGPDEAHWKERGEGREAKAEPAEKKESLGIRTIDGLEATGTRTTITLPAGEIGNEKPIAIVHERWYSSDLQVVVLSRHSDPRMGETTYRLANVSRTEPDKTLFDVPEGYTLKDAPPRPDVRWFHKRPEGGQQQ
jgi:hypothetical protein